MAHTLTLAAARATMSNHKKCDDEEDAGILCITERAALAENRSCSA